MLFQVLPPSRDSIRPRLGGELASSGSGCPDPDEAVVADEGEAHDVLLAVADTAQLPLAVGRLEQAGVRGGIERAVTRSDAESMDVVDGLALPLGVRLGGLLFGRLVPEVLTAAGGDSCGEQHSEHGGGHRWCSAHAAPSYYPA